MDSAWSSVFGGASSPSRAVIGQEMGREDVTLHLGLPDVFPSYELFFLQPDCQLTVVLVLLLFVGYVVSAHYSL